MNQQRNLLSIGAFAGLTRLSIKALRLYDQLDLLQPHHVDPQSGYRFYEQDQLTRARMIRSLRDMDMPLATIRLVLAALDSSPADAESLVREYASMRERKIEQIREQVQHFIKRLQQENNPMSLEVQVKKIESQRVLSVTHHVKVDQLNATIHDALDQLFGMVGDQKEEPAGNPFGIYHGAINDQEDGPIEICLPVTAKIKAAGDVKVKQLEGGNAASVVMTGAQCDFPAILGGYDATADWIQKNGYQMAESPREIWHHEQGPDAKMEVVWLFK